MRSKSNYMKAWIKSILLDRKKYCQECGKFTTVNSEDTCLDCFTRIVEENFTEEELLKIYRGSKKHG